ncbi:MAG: hypothetical protein K2X81_18725 [Candidatus Obscuribacterales bacterium]|nr:hypothetical protein [Candidatus Obscuribacterales bacterium]
MTKGKKKTAKKCLDANGKFEGYKFEEDDIANQMAYLFAGEEGEKEAARILTEANEKFGEPLQVGERRDFIKGEVKRKAASVDNNFQSGLMDIFNTLKDKNQPCSGEEAGKEVAFNLMKGLGLNVDKDNLQTQYDPGPPQIFMITWVNRPGENLANKDSSINKLAEAMLQMVRMALAHLSTENWSYILIQTRPNWIDNAHLRTSTQSHSG